MDNVEVLERILGTARGIATELNLGWLDWLLEQEQQHLLRREMRVLLLGPASAGKTSTLLSTLGPAGLDSDGIEILPVNVNPTTAQIVDVYCGEGSLRAELRYDNGREERTDSVARLREVIAQADPALRRVVVQVPRPPQLPAGVVFTDSPGVGADEGQYADQLVEEALALADVLLFHVRISRGLGPAKELLQRVQRLYPYPDLLPRKLIPVFTDARTPARVPEILSGMADLLGFPVTQHVAVPRRGATSELQDVIEQRWESPMATVPPQERVKAALEHVVLPELRGALETRRVLQADQDRSREFMRQNTARARRAKQVIRARADHHRAAATSELQQHANRKIEQIRIDLDGLIDGSSRFIWETLKDECTRTLVDHHETFFDEEVKGLLTVRLETLAREVNDELVAFEQEAHQHEVVLDLKTPGFDGLGRAAGDTFVGQGARQFLGHLGRLGGRGGVKLGTMNFTRQVVARTYRVFGKRAPAELIRRGIPRAVRHLGSALKFLSKQVWIIDVAIEVFHQMWNLIRAKARVHKHAQTITQAWLHGPKPTLWGRIKGTKPPPGVLEDLRTAVDDAWDGRKRTEDGKHVDTADGIEDQISNAEMHLDDHIRYCEEQLTQLSLPLDFKDLTHRVDNLAAAARKL